MLLHRGVTSITQEEGVEQIAEEDMKETTTGEEMDAWKGKSGREGM